MYVLVNKAVPLLPITIDCVPPGLALYVTVVLGVPVNAIVALPLGQTLWFEFIETVGGGTTVMVTVPVCGCEQPGVPGDVALINV